MDIYKFKKGDKIPQFVEKYDENILKGEFEMEVKVFVSENLTEVYPLEEIDEGVDGFSIMKFTNLDSNKGGYIQGIPTWVYRFPYGDNRNNFKGIYLE